MFVVGVIVGFFGAVIGEIVIEVIRTIKFERREQEKNGDI